MENRSDSAAIAVAIGLIVILLLVVGGVAAMFLVRTQRTSLEIQAVQAEKEAVMQMELARAEADAAAARPSSLEAESPSVDSDAIRAAIEVVLRTQQDAWNRGDLDAFMEHYAQSESLTFSSGGKTTRGWAATLKRYQERYPTAEKMGRVDFMGLEITPLGGTAALVLGQWRVEREVEPISGNFSLVLRNIDGHWRIIHDHTSRLTE